jgi:hypothetical protein
MAAYLFALSLLTVWFVWPIYQDAYLFITAGVSLLVGLAIGAWKSLRKVSNLTVLLSILVSFIVLALPLSNPRALFGGGKILDGLIEALAGPVQAWKQIVTIELPLGTYHSLLSPVLVLYLLTGFLFGWLLFGPISRYWYAAGSVLAIVIFGISFGLTGVPGDFSLFGLRLPIETPLVTGSVLFVTLVVYLNWGARATRRQSLMVRAESLGTTGNLIYRKLRRSLMGVLVVAVAVAVTVASMQLVGVSSNRQVLRSGIEKVKHLQHQTSPLSTYRMYFTNSQLLTSPLLTYSVNDAPDRIRIATMPYYDGDTFTVAPKNSANLDDNSLFSRLPAELPASQPGPERVFNIQIATLDSIWLPMVSGVRRVQFAGAGASKLADELFVNRKTYTGAIIPGSSNNATYQVTYNAADTIDPNQITPSTATIAPEFIPEQLTAWLEAQNASISTGADLIDIAKKLRDRGYLSHSLTDPANADNTETWMSLVELSSFEKSTAGHNLARIDKMFKDLLTKQEQSSGANQVATAGDDEQFATAIALIAAAKGFPSRVVVGFRTGQSEDVPGVPSCSESGDLGTCSGANLAAWAEVQGSNGQWLAIDSTPQFELPLSLTTPPQGDPQRPTDAGEDSGTVLPPTKASPSTSGECAKNPKACEPQVDPWQAFLEFLNAYVLPVLGYLAIGSIFVGPFFVIILMKRRRRRARHEHEIPFARIVGAWEEFVDTSIDFGAPTPRNLTRLEYARQTQSPDVIELANMANMMAFGSSEVESVELDDDEIDAMVVRSWDIYDVQLRNFQEGAKRFARIRAALSMKSFVRALKPKDQLEKLKSAAMNFSQGAKFSDGSALRGLWESLRKLITKRKSAK